MFPECTPPKARKAKDVCGAGDGAGDGVGIGAFPPSVDIFRYMISASGQTVLDGFILFCFFFFCLAGFRRTESVLLWTAIVRRYVFASLRLCVVTSLHDSFFFSLQLQRCQVCMRLWVG